MVESEADGLSEEVMLGAVVFGHEQMQIAIKAINELAAEAGKPKWDWQPPAANAELDSAVAAHAQAALSRGVPDHREAGSATRKHQRDQGSSDRRRSPAARRRSATADHVDDEFVQAREQHRAPAHPRTASRASTAATRRRCARSPSKVGVLPRTHGSALFTRGETQALVVDDARHRPRRADHRRARRRTPRAVHAPLQLPAVLGRRDRHDGLAEAPRNRPRQPRPPRRAGRDAGHGDVPVRHPRRLGNPRVERLELDGLACAAAACR